MAFLHHMCICVYLCVALYTRIQVSTETRRGWQVCWDGSYRHLGTTQHVYWKPSSGWLQGQHTCLTPETFLQSISLIFRCGKKGRQTFGPVECSAFCWSGSFQRRKDQMLLWKSPLVLISSTNLPLTAGFLVGLSILTCWTKEWCLLLFWFFFL